VMPFLTEEIWHQLNPGCEEQTIGFLPLPVPEPAMVHLCAIQSMQQVQGVVSAVRTIRGKFNIHPGKTLEVTIHGSEKPFGTLIRQMEFLAKAHFAFTSLQLKPEFCAAAKVNDLDIFVNLADLVDKNAEVQRLTAKIEKITATLQAIEKKFANKEFVQGAPAHILEGAKKQRLANEQELSLLNESLNDLIGKKG
ncbi:MAG: class I tRNA ligase family protein, partial [Silvanigrellaceae bacterium]|nr:class I tRNA ligase family protein [Silvanigrellaceae bacterium]